MNDFQPVYPETINLDPYKRVRYSNGLVLGVDEFVQEELYLLEKHRRHNRSLHGYGTFCGLKLGLEQTDGNWDVMVGPGIALNPKGQEIRVPEAQCASLDSWVYKQGEAIEQLLGGPGVTPPPAAISIYLVLCHRECETDYVPVPSGPCQSLDKTSVASRIADDFELVLQLEPPDQAEDDTIQALIQLLRQIEISDAPGGLSEDDLKRLVRSLTDEVQPPVFDPPLGEMRMRADQAESFMHTAFRVWVTEVKPSILASGRNCASGPPNEACVLLGRIDCSVENTVAGYRLSGPVEFNEDERPFLLQTRLLQEHLLRCCTGGAAPSTSETPSSIDETNLMHLTGDETVEGHKTFTDPIALGADGRVQRRIMLPPAAGTAVNTRVEHDLFRANAPALRFALNGEASFTLQVPDDIEYGVAPRVRVVWGVKSNLPSVTFTWQVRNRYAEPDSIFGPFSGGGGTLSETVSDVKTGQVYVTSFNNLPDSVTADDVYGALRVKLSDVTPVAQELFLLQVDVAYVANRLGRDLS